MSVKNIQTDAFNTTTFTLEGVNVSIANAIRRSIINDIPTWVFMTSPHEKNQATFHTNTSQMNNELLKQRLSCIPVHMQHGYEGSIDLEDYYLEVDVENTTDDIIQVTTEHFIVKKKSDNQPISVDVNRAIFPPYMPPDAADAEEYFILFIRLKPRISEEIPGEKIHFTCDFSVATAKESAMFNVASTCTYGNTIDTEKADQELSIQTQKWRDQGMSPEDIADEIANWWLLDAKRIYKPNSFDFTIQSVGVYENTQLVFLGINFILQKIQNLLTDLDEFGDGQINIEPSLSTMENCYDIVFEDDYTLGKAIEFMLYKNYFSKDILSFCGYIKMHPHDEESIIRIAFHPSFPQAKITIEEIIHMMREAIFDAEDVFIAISNVFSVEKDSSRTSSYRSSRSNRSNRTNSSNNSK